MRSFYDHLFTTNVYNKPLVIKDRDAILTLIVRLILMDPGTISTIPDAGVGLVRKYRYLSEDKLPDLRDDISDQIKKFLPYFKYVDVNVSMDNNKILHIILDLDDNIYTLKSTLSKNNEFSLESLF